MSIVGMRKFFRRSIRVKVGKKHFHFGTPVQIVFWGIVVIFVVGSYNWFGPGRGGRGAGPTQAETAAAARKVSKNMATVGGDTITREQYEKQIAMLGLEEGSLAEQPMRKLQTLEQMIDEKLQLAAVKTEKVSVGNDEIEAKRAQLIDQAMASRFPNKRDLKEYLQRKKLTLEQYRQQVADERFGDNDLLREGIQIEKLRNTVQGRVQVSDQELQASFTEYHALHILIMPKEEQARAEAAAKAAKSTLPATFNADEAAKKKADDLLAQISKGGDFAKLAGANSDDPGSKVKGGDLGWFKAGQMVPEFDAAVQALKPGGISSVVKSQFGYHIIKLVETRSTLPKDFDKNKEQLRQTELSKRKEKAWDQYMKGLRDQFPATIEDAELRGYKDLEDHKLDPALADLSEAVKNDPEAMAARYELAMLYRQRKDNQKAADMLQQIVENEQSARYPDAHLLLGDILMDLGKKDDAMASYRNASDRAVANDFSAYMIHAQLQDKFKKMGRTDLIKAEQEWIDDFMKRQKESGGGGMGMPMGMPMNVPVK